MVPYHFHLTCCVSVHASHYSRVLEWSPAISNYMSIRFTAGMEAIPKVTMILRAAVKPRTGLFSGDFRKIGVIFHYPSYFIKKKKNEVALDDYV